MKTINTNKVLIAVDYNLTAKNVAQVGFAFAKAMDAEVTLLHVLNDPQSYTLYDPTMGFSGLTTIDLLEVDNKKLKKSTAAFLNNIKEDLDDAAIEILVKEGDFIASLLETATEIKAGIIVIGSHSKKWLETMVLGNSTRKVLNHAETPILIVPLDVN